MKIDLIDLECDIKYHFELASIGGSHPHGGEENLTNILIILGIICNEINIINLLTEEQISEIEDKILEERLTF